MNEEFLAVLKRRFLGNGDRHPGMEWEVVVERLQASMEKVNILVAMEETGGEPDIVGGMRDGGEIWFMDCSAESPKGRRSCCYDDEALESRKTYKPKLSALGMAKEMGVEVLDEAMYLELQKWGEFDLKTSSWLQTPAEVRSLGGAIFGDRRYGRVFVFHNGAESYYAARGFRGMVRI